jgi:membrane-bound lytic murein transglycosylase B
VTREPTRHRLPRRLLSAICPALLALAAVPALALDEGRPDVSTFIGEMAARHGFDAATLAGLFAQVQSRPSIIEAMMRPAEKTMSWDRYRALFITDRRVARGVAVAQDQADSLRSAASAGVPEEFLLAITGVETFYGENTGKHRVVDALATLAFDYEPRRTFFRGELEQYLLMAREESLDPLQPVGSYAGAMGIPQFMPSSFRAYAVDGDDDGRRNLWSDWSDVFASVANYLRRHGWRSGEPVMVPADVTGARIEGLSSDNLALSETVGSLQERGVKFAAALPLDTPAVLVELPGANGPEYRVGFTNYYAITRYNRSALYASAVNDLAEAIAAARPAPTVAAPAADEAPPAFTSQ